MLVPRRAAPSPPPFPTPASEATDEPASRPARTAGEACRARPAGDPRRLVPRPRGPGTVALLGRRGVDRPARPAAAPDAARPAGPRRAVPGVGLRAGGDRRERHAGERPVEARSSAAVLLRRDLRRAP